MPSFWIKISVVTGILMASAGSCLAVSPGHIYSARYVGTVPEKPELLLGGGAKRPFWHRIDLELDRKALTTTWKLGTTLWIETTDCHGREMYAGHIFISDTDVFQIRSLGEAKYQELLSTNTGKTVPASIYMTDEDYRSTSRICLQAGGGTMWYYGFKGKRVEVVKP